MTDSIPVIAVDGPSGSGKGMVAAHLAKQYGFSLLDSGVLYRLVGIAAREVGIDLDAEAVDYLQLGSDHRAVAVKLHMMKIIRYDS